MSILRALCIPACWNMSYAFSICDMGILWLIKQLGLISPLIIFSMMLAIVYPCITPAVSLKLLNHIFSNAILTGCP